VEDLDGRIGEGWGGHGVLGCHVNLVIAERATPTAAAALGALASPTPGHVPFLACAGPGRLIRPPTVIVNKTTLTSPTLETLTWGAAQIGVARAVLDGLRRQRLRADLVVLVALWLDPAVASVALDADVETAVCDAARVATSAAVSDALASRPDAELTERLAAITNGFYGGR